MNIITDFYQKKLELFTAIILSCFLAERIWQTEWINILYSFLRLSVVGIDSFNKKIVQQGQKGISSHFTGRNEDNNLSKIVMAKIVVVVHCFYLHDQLIDSTPKKALRKDICNAYHLCF